MYKQISSNLTFNLSNIQNCAFSGLDYPNSCIVGLNMKIMIYQTLKICLANLDLFMETLIYSFLFYLFIPLYIIEKCL